MGQFTWNTQNTGKTQNFKTEARNSLIIRIASQGNWICNLKSCHRENCGPSGFTDEFCQIYREEIIITVYQLFQRIEQEWMFCPFSSQDQYNSYT